MNNENPDQVVAVQEFQFDEMDEGQDWTTFVNIDTRVRKNFNFFNCFETFSAFTIICIFLGG